MKLRQAQRSVAHITWPFAVLLLLAVTACEALPPRPEVVVEGSWRVVERTGDAKFRLPGNAAFEPADAGSTVLPASEVVTGTGSRLILARGEDQIVLGPAAGIVLPRFRRHDLLQQQAGVVRYRIAAGAADPFRIDAPAVRGEAFEATFDLAVDATGRRSVFEVSAGELRVSSDDGRHGAVLKPGQMAVAGEHDEVQLAVREAPDQPLEPAAPVIIPAVKSMTAEARPGGDEALAVTAAAGGSPELAAGATMAAKTAAAEPQARAVKSGEAAAPLALAQPGQVVLPTRQSRGAAPPPRPSGSAAASRELQAGTGADPLFDRLTEGLLEGLHVSQPVRPLEIDP
jgi:hypothetical protein